MKNNNTRTTRQKAFQRYSKLRGLHAVIGDDRVMVEQLAFISDVIAIERSKLYQAICDKYDLSKGLTIKDFVRICQAESISLTRRSKILTEKQYAGYYWQRAPTYPEIYIEPNLRSKERLMIAAHELSHHFLRSEQNRTGIGGKPTQHFSAGELAPTVFFAEMEADTLASMLITGDGSLPEPKEVRGNRLSTSKIRAAVAGGAIDVK